MSVSTELNQLSDGDLSAKIERIIQDCIGDLAEGKDWKVWIYSSSDYCQIVIKGPTQTRERFFFDDGQTLPEKISEWLTMYPFR